MKESIGNAMLFNLVIVFVVILIAFFVGSLSYTKAYKVKNKIIEEIEKEGESAGRQFTSLSQAENAYNDTVRSEVSSWLRGGSTGQGIGYRINTNRVSNCPTYKGTNALDSYNDYEYCVYKISTCTSLSKGRCGVYYHVTTYMYFDLPIIDQLLKIPVNGETRTFTVQRN